MDVNAATALLGGLSPAQFMRRHWQKKPLLVRQAWPGVLPPLARSKLFALAARDDVESRLVVRDGERWQMRRGPFPRRDLPPLSRPDWTLLVQGLDLHDDAARAMLDRFRFVPEARLDDLMVSYATPGGGVGPHVDSYDVFLLQVQGRRRWRVGRVADRALVDGLPVKILQNFQPSEQWELEPGDMLYLPPLWGHDGIAQDECMTCSVGFRVPTRAALAAELLQQLADEIEPGDDDPLYRDATQAATESPGAIPPALGDFAARALQRALADPTLLGRALGARLTEPKPQVWFDGGQPLPHAPAAVALDRRTRMMYDAHHVFINGEAFRAAGADARLMRQLADRRRLEARALARASEDARALMDDWAQAGWLHAESVQPELQVG